MNFFFNRIRQKDKFNNLVVLSFATLMSLLVLISTWSNGIGITPDTVNYFAATDSFLGSGNFIGFNGQPMSLWPPLYPLLLALLSVLGLSHPLAALVINIFSAFLIIYFFSKLLDLFQIQVRLKIFCLSWAVMSGVLLSMLNTAWTEPLFILLFIFFTYYLLKYLKEGDNKFFITIIIIAGMSALLRYLGVAMIIAGCVLIFYNFKELNFKKRLVKAMQFVFFSSLPLAIWMIRNLIVTDTLAGPRTFEKNTFTEQLVSFFNTISLWISWSFLYHVIRFIFLALVITMALYFYFKKKNQLNINTIFKNTGFIILIYIALIIVLSTIGTGQLIDSRYLAPIYLFILALVFYLLNKKINFKNVWVITLVIMITASFVLQLSVSLYIDNKMGVQALSTGEWRSYIESTNIDNFNFIEDKKLVTNSPSGFYLDTGRYSDFSAIKGESLEEFVNRTGDDFYLVWYFGTTLHPSLNDFDWIYDKFESELLQLNESTDSEVSSRIYHISGLR